MQIEFFNPDKTLKAVITLHKLGYYHVELYRWTQEIVPEGNYVSEFYWEPVLSPSLAGTLAEAESIAREMLKIYV